jgi:putative ABC transport system ATP-binding protein
LAVSALELRELVKHYSSGSEVVRAVDGVSLTVGAGEFVAVYGPSGSGKTTLLMLAAGLLEPDSGSVHFGGREVTRMRPREGAIFRRRELGFVFQSFHLMPTSSALDNAALKLLADGWSPVEAREQARPWLERVGLGDRADHTPAQLSMGECQRVAIARALANEPRLVLADEPTGNLDTRRGAEVLALLRDLCQEREIPVLLVTHDPHATALVDRIHTLRDGRLTEGLDADLTETLGSPA